MKLSVSNIGWSEGEDSRVYGLMNKYGFLGLEIAPTRVFSVKPYDNPERAAVWRESLRDRYGFEISSLQSIWYGRQERLFGSAKEREILFELTKQAIDFASAMGCKNLVFGCPKNRVLTGQGQRETGIEFFRKLGDYAYARQTVLSIEANPPIYGTNYINDTYEAIELVKTTASPGFCLNLDTGTMIENGEPAEMIRGQVKLINHVHISEPGLKPVRKRALHRELREILNEEGYRKFISIEMGRTDDAAVLERVLGYGLDVFSGAP